MLPRRLIPLAASCMVLALTPASSHAGQLTLTSRSQPARAGQVVQLRATVPAARSCQLRADAHRLRVPTTGTRTFVISARVSRRARPGAHSLSLRCAEKRVRTRVAVTRSAANRKARGGLFRGRLRITAVPSPGPGALPVSAVAQSTTPFPRTVLPASAEAQLWWDRNVAAITGSFRNGQCTDWAEQRRPDIVHSAYMRRFDRHGYASVVTSWDAKHWAQHAAEAGLAVGRAPVIGAIMVFAPGSYGTGDAGHVAVVEAVAANGSFEISAMHAPDVGSVTRQTYDARTAAAMATDPGIAFVL